ncbi:MAG: tRNA (N6-isopentenyl adenosine(37)-C2)-methylthiotransferase MiaB [Solirubrobacteraceae bacterium]
MEQVKLTPIIEQKYTTKTFNKKTKNLFIESFGCAMNFSDSEVVASILKEKNYEITINSDQADLILLNTCSIREKAEQTVRNRLGNFNNQKRQNPKLIIGILGCMAERIKEKLLVEEKIVNLVVGPDAYRDLPNLIENLENTGEKGVNVLLSRDETYGELLPVRLNNNKISAFVTITRGCDNMCTFCVVPFTRGRERSRDPYSILNECLDLQAKGYKEIILLGQNVDSYIWYGGGLKKDFNKASDIQKATTTDFALLMEMIAKKIPAIRIRFSTSNPQDIKDNVLHTMAKYPNICKAIHLPVQSGSNTVLKRMNRLHTREEYMALIDRIRKIVPNCGISQDMIAGFCGETEEEHQETLSLMDYVKYNFGYMYAYSERPGTLAYKKMKDDVPLAVKKRRLQEIIDKQQENALFRMKEFLGKEVEVLIEKESKKNKDNWSGKNTQNVTVVFNKNGSNKPGDFVKVKIIDCTTGTLLGVSI